MTLYLTSTEIQKYQDFGLNNFHTFVLLVLIDCFLSVMDYDTNFTIFNIQWPIEWRCSSIFFLFIKFIDMSSRTMMWPTAALSFSHLLLNDHLYMEIDRRFHWSSISITQIRFKTVSVIMSLYNEQISYPYMMNNVTLMICDMPNHV